MTDGIGKCVRLIRDSYELIHAEHISLVGAEDPANHLDMARYEWENAMDGAGFGDRELLTQMIGTQFPGPGFVSAVRGIRDFLANVETTSGGKRKPAGLTPKQRRDGTEDLARFMLDRVQAYLPQG